MPNLGLPLWAQAKGESFSLRFMFFLQQPLECLLSGSSIPLPLESKYLISDSNDTAARSGNHDNSRPSFNMTRLSSYVSPQRGALCHNMTALLFSPMFLALYLSEVLGDGALLGSEFWEAKRHPSATTTS